MAETRAGGGGRSGAGGSGAKRIASHHAAADRPALRITQTSSSASSARTPRPSARSTSASASAAASTSTSQSSKGRTASSSKMPFKSSAQQGASRPTRRASAQVTPSVTDVEPRVCRHCRATSIAFWCERCALAQLERFRDNITRVGQARDEARGRAAASLGEEVTSMTSLHALPDPFGPQAGEPHPIASHRGRAIRARWNELFAQVGDRKSEQMRSDAEVGRLSERMRVREEALAQRRAALEQARLLLDGASAAEQDVARLKDIHSARQEELTSARRRRQRALLDIYSVTPPTSSQSTATLHKARSRYVPGAFEPKRAHDAAPPPTTFPPTSDWTLLPAHCRLALPLPTPSDIRRFPRQDVNAAAALVAQLLQRQAATCGVALPFSLGIDKDGKWALRSDPLWVGSGIDSKHSLHLGKSAYELMAGGGPTAGTISPAASTLASGAGGAFTREKIEASLASLRTSTFASLGSFVQLPGRNHQTWGRASVMRAGGDEATTPPPAEAAAPSSSSQPPPAVPSSTALSSAQTFCRALIMLAFNAAYLAWTQGAVVDLIAAGGSTLKLLAEAAAAPGSSAKSHTEGPLRSLGDFTFPALDFSKLLQLHELGSEQQQQQQKQQRGGTSAGSAVKGKSSAGTGGPSTSRSTSKQQQPATTTTKLRGIEESYIDAGQAAASILDVRPAPANGSPGPADTSSSRKAAVTPRRQPASFAPTTTDKSKLPPSSLSSLRQRGQDVARQGQGRTQPATAAGPSRGATPTRPSASPTSRLASEAIKATPSKHPSPLSQRHSATETPPPPGSKSRPREDRGGGTVTFNGQRIALGNTDSSSGGEDASSDGDEAARRRRRSSAARRAGGGGAGSTRKKAPAAAAAINGSRGDDDWDVV